METTTVVTITDSTRLSSEVVRHQQLKNPPISISTPAASNMSPKFGDILIVAQSLSAKTLPTRGFEAFPSFAQPPKSPGGIRQNSDCRARQKVRCPPPPRLLDEYVDPESLWKGIRVEHADRGQHGSSHWGTALVSTTNSNWLI